ncbi:SufD family Fe-S cluster assembly protein [Companilactobacillus furfuricola]|uniref:SufD family Fe-S cluster assembly protein n=1 Tax=Companilactobacillus furfuricola TaxID=1462575 RepID=UPI000F77EB1A|nr:SufD family Fe-S cluster assembly protein [Companilactobacillus furfuricola]
MSNEISAELETFANEHGEPHWLVKRRLDALKEIESAPDFLQDEQFTPLLLQAPNKVKLTKELLNAAKVDEDSVGVYQIGQSTLENTLDEDDEDNGVILTDIFTAFRQHPRLVEGYFLKKLLPQAQDKNSAAHMALLNSGLFLYVPKNYELKDTVYLNMLQDSINDQPLVTHLFIYADEGSSVKVVQRLKTIGEQTDPLDLIVETLARPKSSVQLTAIESLGPKTPATIRRHTQASRDAKVLLNIVSKNQGSTMEQIVAKQAHKTAKINITFNGLQTQSEQIYNLETTLDYKDLAQNNIVQTIDGEELKNVRARINTVQKDEVQNYASELVSGKGEIVQGVTDGKNVNRTDILGDKMLNDLFLERVNEYQKEDTYQDVLDGLE